MQTTVRVSRGMESFTGFPAGLPASEYKIKSTHSGQGFADPDSVTSSASSYIEGMWHHKHWTQVMGRVRQLHRMAHDCASSAQPVIVQTTMFVSGSYRRSWIYKDRWGYEESIHLWVVPTSTPCDPQ